MLNTLQVGDEIEGDFHTSPAFEPEGAECWVAHRNTNNISIIDVSNALLKKVISTGDSPMDIVFTEDYALVACYGNDIVQVFDWRKDELIREIPINGQPARIEVSDDNSIAVVSTELNDNGNVIDLEDFSVSVFDDFPTGLAGFSFITSNTRNTVNFSGFDVSPNGSQIANGFGGPLKLYNVTNNTYDSIPEVINAARVAYNLDGTKLIAVVFGNQPMLYQIDPMTHDILATVEPDVNVNNFNGELAMTHDGNRLLLPGTNSAILVRFDHGDYLPITTDAAVFWCDIDGSGTYGVAGGYNAHIVDMQSGVIQATTSGISLNMGSISDDGQYVLAFDPLRRERVETYQFTGNGLFPLDHVHPGSELEGDAPYSVRFTHDGSRALVVNSLSGTISVIDVEQKQLEKIIQLDNYEIYHIAITSDDKRALVGERLGDQVSIIDLESLEIEQVVYSGGDRPDQTFVHPFGQKAYALNAGSTDAIGVIDLSGAQPKFVKSFPSGNTGISWTNRGIRCNLVMTEDGATGILATPFDDAIQIIDLTTDQIRSSFSTEGFALQTALSERIDGKIYAATTLKNNGEVFIIEDVEGNPVPFGGLSVGANPTRIAYDPLTREFAVCSNDERAIDFIDPFNFRVSRRQNFENHLTPIAVLFSDHGDQFTLLQSSDQNQPNQLQINDENVDIGASPGHYFDLTADGNWAAVVGLHNDELFLVDAQLTGTPVVHRIDLEGWITFGPNPTQDLLRINGKNERLVGKDVNIEVCNSDGIQSTYFKMNSNEAEIDCALWPSGCYFISVIVDGEMKQSGRFIKSN
jgi:DNA-binding beta-propeller fold protein YncE